MASERLCDASFEDCRAPLVALIQKENVEIDIAFWFMDDWMITNALNAKIQSGVKVRMLVDPRSDGAHSEIPPSFATLGTPMRQRIANGILHWKMAIFAGQGVVEFSGANMSRAELDPYYPYSDYVDEAIFFSDDPNIVNSFRTMYDKWWVDTVDYSNFANTAPPFTLTPAYAPPGPYPIESEVCAVVPDGCGLNFLPSSRWQDNYGTKVEYAIGAEKTKIDVDMFRITNAAIANSMIAAFQRGVPIRMIVDMSEYTNTARVWDRYNVDRMFMAGIPLKITKHTGQNHEKSVLIYGQGLAIWGSSNWTSPSFNSQQEHNYFSTSTVKPWYFQWFVNQFERRWNSPQEYQAFVPQPPSMPVNQSPANAATGQSQSVTLRWDGGPWGQQYDIYVGAGAVPTLIASNVVTGAPDPPPNHALGSFQLSGLAPNTTYRWRIVSKTMANLATGGQTWTFTTAGTAPTSGATVTSLSPATGPYTGGTTAQIYGTNFESGATVNFGLAAASKVVFVSPTQLTVTTPPGPQVTAPSGAPVSVTVTNPDHTSGSLASGFVYAATPVPPLRLNVVVPNTGSAQGGTLMTISGSNFASGMTVTVGGSPATVTSTGSNSIQATAPAGNPGTPADIVVTNPKNGQSATLKAAFSYTSSSAPVTLSAISPTSGSSNGGNRVVISGSGLQYGAVVSFGGPPPLYPLNGSGTLATTMAVSYSSDPQVCGTAASLPCMIANTPAFPSAATASVTTDVWVTNMNPATGLIDSGSASAKLTAAYTFVPAPLISVVSPSSGSVSGGSQITITGKYFQSGATVLVCKQQPTPPVCTQAAVVNPISSTSITAVVPANAAGTAAVSVVNPNQEQSNILIFTYQ